MQIWDGRVDLATVLRHDNDKLGWVVLDLRTAKLNATQEGYMEGTNPPPVTAAMKVDVHSTLLSRHFALV